MLQRVYTKRHSRSGYFSTRHPAGRRFNRAGVDTNLDQRHRHRRLYCDRLGAGAIQPSLARLPVCRWRRIPIWLLSSARTGPGLFCEGHPRDHPADRMPGPQRANPTHEEERSYIAGPNRGRHPEEDDWCATAYFYLDKPADELPAIEPYAARVKGLLPNK